MINKDKKKYYIICIVQNDLYTFEDLYHSTKVECGGQYAATPNCGAFYFDDGICGLLEATNLFVNEGDNSTLDIYMLENYAGMHWKQFVILKRSVFYPMYN